MNTNNTFSEKINLALFNSVFKLAEKTSEAENHYWLYHSAECRFPWCPSSQAMNPPEVDLGALNYVGEVLERYGSSFGDNIENFRAVALALAYASSFLSPQMFVGDQKEKFLSRLSQEAGNDLYLSGAAYMLEENPQVRAQKLDELSSRMYSSTEDAMFVLSLFEDSKEGFDKMSPQLIRLWGKDRTLSLIEGAFTLGWLINNCKEVIQANRKKEFAVLRALMKLPSQFIKDDSPVYKTLEDAGYSNLEIRYANSCFAAFPSVYRISDSMNDKGIAAEKASAEFLLAFLNAEENQPTALYDYAESIMQKYNLFYVRYQGHRGIWFAIADSVAPVSPERMLWMLKLLP